ncbi:protein kinase domain-containing protein [Verrucomicrobiota bacterium sgz303538]
MKPPISPLPGVEPVLIPSSSGSSGAARADVYVYTGLDFAARYSIEHGEYLIGMDPSCHLVLGADGVAARHARLTFNNFELIIEALDSSSEVFIEGVQVQLPTRVRPDQEVQIGSTRLLVRLNDATAKQFADALWDADLGLAPVRQQLEGKRHKVLTTVGRGGMGVILQARDLHIRRTVAMKVMRTGSQFSRENVLRFIAEAQLTGQLEHPNIVPVYELGIDEHGETFYTMKFVKGITLEAVLRGIRSGDAELIQKYPLGVLLTVFQKICDAVAFAHSREIVHRDLKPDNIMIGAYGEVLVMDWGLAKRLNEDAPPEEEVRVAIPEPQVQDPHRGFETLHGVVVGSPPYVSPEQARGELDKIDCRSDVYVLGAILYAILTLRAPVYAGSMQEMLEKIAAGEIEPPIAFNRVARTRQPQLEDIVYGRVCLAHCPGGRVPEGLSAVTMKALQVDPADRYASVEEMQTEIAAYQGGFATKAERATPWRQMVLFASRNRREVALLFIFALVLQLVLVAFLVRINTEKNRALADEERIRTSQSDLKKVLEELRGTAPTFAQEAATLIEQQQPEEALEKIDYALEQLPNKADYHFLRGNILQTLLRFDDAEAAYEEVLKRNPKHKAAKENLQLTQKLIAQRGDAAQPPPALLRNLHSALVNQKRIGEALYVLDQIGKDQQLFFNTWKAAFEKRGLRNRFETMEDETIRIDLSKAPRGRLPDLRQLRGAPVSGLNLDDTPLTDISPLKGLPLQTLSLNRTLVRDLSPIIGMPLRALNLDGVPAMSLAPLSHLPLESLRISAIRIETLAALRGLKLEQLNLSGCRRLEDLSPLTGMPLQSVDISRTGVSDLSPLVKSPIRELNLEGCVDLTDLHPLMEIKTLESVLIPAQCKDIEFLRNHPSLKRLSYKKLTQPEYEFWEEFDAKRGN